MIIIAHRGLLEGPDRQLENQPEQVIKALNMGFDVEIDVWALNDRFYLGHHELPFLEVNMEFLKHPGLWLHAKNLDAMYALNSTPGMNWPNFFYHNTDSHTLTSGGYIWTYPGFQLSPDSVFVMPETLGNLSEVFHKWKLKEKNSCYAVCTDYAILVDKLLNT